MVWAAGLGLKPRVEARIPGCLREEPQLLS